MLAYHSPILFCNKIALFCLVLYMFESFCVLNNTGRTENKLVLYKKKVSPMSTKAITALLALAAGQDHRQGDATEDAVGGHPPALQQSSSQRPS